MPPLTASAPGQQREVIVAIDFGSSYTKVAFSLDSSQQLRVIRTHDGGDLIPTRLCIDPNGNARIAAEGESATQDEILLEWFKLLLLHDEDWPPHARQQFGVIANARRNYQQANMGILHVISAFLDNVWRITKDIMVQQLGLQPHHDMSKVSLRLIITVPAVWNSEAIQRMERAVCASGIRDSVGGFSLRFMREPEAAAVASFVDRPRGLLLEQRGVVIVCDCGGITADAATYEITALPDGGVTADQLVQADSGFYGGVFLQEGFTKLLDLKISSFGAVAEASVSPQFKDRALEWWHHAVSHLPDISAIGETYTLPIELVYPGVEPAYPGALGELIVFTRADLVSILAGIVTGIGRLVENQSLVARQRTGKFPKYVLLTGGMARYSWLESAVAHEVSNTTAVTSCHRDVRLSTIVARGAIMQELADRRNSINGSISGGIRSSLTRASYGIVSDGEMGSNISWLIQKGSSVPSTGSIRKTVPASAFSSRTDIRCGVPLNILTLIIYSTTAPHMSVTPNHAEACLFCRIEWLRQTPIVSNTDTVALEITHDGRHDISVSVVCNGERVNSDSISVDLSPQGIVN